MSSRNSADRGVARRMWPVDETKIKDGDQEKRLEAMNTLKKG